MIYIDNVPWTGWCHLFADTIEELHEFAEKNGIKRCWFENKRGKYQPHYDVKGYLLYPLIKAGAELVNWKATPEMLRARYNPSYVRPELIKPL